MANVAGPSKKILYDETTCLSGTSLSLLSSEVYSPTSTLEYVNSQLVAHGFGRSPGLSLDGLANDDSERIVRCLLSMLSQRMEDLGRTEELGSKLRTISYENERLQSMYRTAVDTSANAEREMNLFKSKMAASQRALTSEVSAHKQTSSELQRTRTSLQYLRSTSQNELKRKDKEVERILDRWNKVSDAQIKLAGAHSGLRCANLAVGEEEYGKGKGLMEDALDQAEEARKELMTENDGFRSVILATAKAVQGMIYTVKGLSTDVHVEEPIPLSHTVVFAPPTSSLPHPDNAHAKLRELMAALREAVSTISSTSSSSANVIDTEEEVIKLKDLVESLRVELTQARQSSNTLATQVLDRFTTQASGRLLTGQDPTPKEAAEMSMELIGVLERDQLRETLNKRTMELQAERDQFTEATVKLGREKAALETERLKLLQEKRQWAVDKMLAELPPTPGQDPNSVTPPGSSKQAIKQPLPSPPRGRPRKVGGSKGTSKSPSKKTALAKHTSGGITSISRDSLPPKKRGVRMGNAVEEAVDVLYELEIQQVEPTIATENRQRSTTPEDSPPVIPPAAEMKTSLPLVLPTTFKLPPPSPASSLATLDLGDISPNALAMSSSTVPSFDAIPLSARPPIISLARPYNFPSPRTPRPLVNSHLKHAYSPARPSPLSRILMIADSPPSPPPAPPIEGGSEGIESMAPLESRTNIVMGAMSKGLLARGVKLEAPIDEPSPLRELTGADLNGCVWRGSEVAGTSGKSNRTSHEEKRLTTKGKGKERAVPVVSGVTATEKENVATFTKGSGVGKPKTIAVNEGTANTRVKASTKLGAETRHIAVAVKSNFKPPSINETAARTGTSSGPSRGSGIAPQTGAGVIVRAGGARRVPIGSANTGKVRMRKV